jgi:formylglycine-generating enzyme required for sulfatase activity
MKNLRTLLSVRRLLCASLTAGALACSAPPAPPAPNERPVARAGADQSVATQTRVTVDGVESSDPEGSALSYQWEQAEEDLTKVVISPDDRVSFQFTPTVAGTYSFILVVSDGDTTSLPDTVRIAATSSNNRAPIADAGPDLVIGAGASVPLSALNSSDPNGDELTYLWTVLSAPDSITLADSTGVQTHFIAVTVGEYRFRLRVSDGELSTEDEVSILVRAASNLPPIAEAGEDQQVAQGTLVVLDASASSDPDGDALALSYRWSVGRVPGGSVILSDTTAIQPSFVAEFPGEYVFGLTVSDGELFSLQDVVTITVLERLFNEADGMIEIPVGSFVMGSSSGAADEGPEHAVEISTFWIDKYEVTTSAYASCVETGTCAANGTTAGCNSLANDRAEHPVNCVNWQQAATYCLWAQKRLPTEAEWERAARGDDGRTFPWGDDNPNRDLLNYNNIVGSTTAVGSYPLGVSYFGLHDMGGNVQEWTGDFYAADYYSNSPASNPQGPSEGTLRVVRGASWKLGIPQEVLTTTVRFAFVPGNGDPSLGFRCASDTPPMP